MSYAGGLGCDSCWEGWTPSYRKLLRDQENKNWEGFWSKWPKSGYRQTPSMNPSAASKFGREFYPFSWSSSHKAFEKLTAPGVKMVSTQAGRDISAQKFPREFVRTNSVKFDWTVEPTEVVAENGLKFPVGNICSGSNCNRRIRRGDVTDTSFGGEMFEFFNFKRTLDLLAALSCGDEAYRKEFERLEAACLKGGGTAAQEACPKFVSLKLKCQLAKLFPNRDPSLDFAIETARQRLLVIMMLDEFQKLPGKKPQVDAALRSMLSPAVVDPDVAEQLGGRPPYDWRAWYNLLRYQVSQNPGSLDCLCFSADIDPTQVIVLGELTGDLSQGTYGPSAWLAKLLNILVPGWRSRGSAAVTGLKATPIRSMRRAIADRTTSVKRTKESGASDLRRGQDTVELKTAGLAPAKYALAAGAAALIGYAAYGYMKRPKL